MQAPAAPVSEWWREPVTTVRRLTFGVAPVGREPAPQHVPQRDTLASVVPTPPTRRGPQVRDIAAAKPEVKAVRSTDLRPGDAIIDDKGREWLVGEVAKGEGAVLLTVTPLNVEPHLLRLATGAMVTVRKG